MNYKFGEKLEQNISVKHLGLLAILFYLPSVVSGESEDKLLLQAAIKNDKQEFSKLLNSGADPNWIQQKRHSEWTMCEVTNKGKEELLLLALAANADIDIKNKSVATAVSGTVFCALSHRNIKAVEILIENNVDLDFNACFGCSIVYEPIVGAAGLKEYQAVWLMLKSYTASAATIDRLIFPIEKHPIATNGEAYEWRGRVVQYLRESGYSVTPWEESQ